MDITIKLPKREDSLAAESVNGGVIHALYESTRDNGNHELQGYITTENAYESEVLTLTNDFQNLTINVTGTPPNKYYYEFEDSNFAKSCAINYGDKTGCTELMLASVLRISNDDITEFRKRSYEIADFSKFTSFNNEIRKIFDLDDSSNANDWTHTLISPRLSKVYIAKVTNLDINRICYNKSLDRIIVDTIVTKLKGENTQNWKGYVDILAIRNIQRSCSKQFTFMKPFTGNISINNLYIGNTTPPTCDDMSNDYIMSRIGNLYVPSDSIQDYLNHTVWGLINNIQGYDFTTDPNGIFAKFN